MKGGDTTKVSGDSFELKNITGEGVTLKLDDDTVITDLRGEDVAKANLKEGMKVTVSSEKQDDGSYIAERVRVRSKVGE